MLILFSSLCVCSLSAFYLVPFLFFNCVILYDIHFKWINNICTADCEYGDKADWCATIGVSASRCTPSDLGKQCCASCEKIIPGGVQSQPETPQQPTNADCPQGDQASYCSTIESFNCYAAAKQCCISCGKYKTNIAGRRYDHSIYVCVMRRNSSCRERITSLLVMADITSKRYEIGCRLVLITNRKSHMDFPLVPISVSLNGVISPNSIALQADYVTVVELR